MHCTLLPTKNVWNWEVYTYFACLVTRKLQPLFKFRLTITQCEDNQTYGFKLLNLSEEPLDCTISLDVCDERKNKAKNQMVLVLREENVKLENMTSYYQARASLGFVDYGCLSNINLKILWLHS